MNKVIELKLQECIKAFADYQESVLDEPTCWVDWLACVSVFQDGDYSKSGEQAIDLLARGCHRHYFYILQILLISMHYTGDISSLDNWGNQLVKAVPLTPWQLSLVELTLGKIDLVTVLSKAKDNIQICQANYYLGESCLSREDYVKAKESFQTSILLGAECIERRFAKKRIENLEKHISGDTQINSFSLAASSSYRPSLIETEREKLLRQDSGGDLLSAISKLLMGQSPEMIFLRADRHRTASWSRIVQRVAESGAMNKLGSQDDDFQWLSREVRYVLADAYKEEFLDRIKEVNLLQEHPMVGNFQFLKGSDLLQYTRFPEYRTVKSKLKFYKEIASRNKMYFLSHRWLDPKHPDPNGIQMQLLKGHILPEAFYWIDYSCLPQSPRTTQEEDLFRESLYWIPALLFEMNFIVLRCNDDGYVERAWCFFELFAANVIGHKISYIFEDATMYSIHNNDERKILEQTLLDMDMPKNLDTADPRDLEPVRLLIQTVAFFFKLRVAENYMALGQHISNGELFFAEDPYYFVATCDFSNVMLWLFDKAKEFGMYLIDLSQDYDQNNYLLELAKKEHFHLISLASESFHKGADSYTMEKKVALDESRLRWFIMNKNRQDSATQLFYIITSMIR